MLGTVNSGVMLGNDRLEPSRLLDARQIRRHYVCVHSR